MTSELKPLVFMSATSILKWANKTQIEYMPTEDIFYVEKDGLFYYFSKADDGYHLVMESKTNLQDND